MRIAQIGTWLMAAATLLGTALSVFNYLSPDSGINGTPGAILVIVSSFILFVLALLLASNRWRSAGLAVFIMVASLLDIAGTAFAAYLLHSQALAALMAVAGLGWLLCLFRRRSARA